jgi:hypothetical protein
VNPFLAKESSIDAKAKEKAEERSKVVFSPMPLGAFGKAPSNSRKKEVHYLANPMPAGDWALCQKKGKNTYVAILITGLLMNS